MTRTLKFRFWDGERMFDEALSLNNDGTYSVRSSTNRINFEGGKWMQFTGLLDKNGKEIYEGDIVFFRACWDLSYQQYFQIVWHEGSTYLTDDHGENVGIVGFGKKFIKGKFDRKPTVDVTPKPHAFSNETPVIQDQELVFPLEFENENSMEVIGNVFSNPVLLANIKI